MRDVPSRCISAASRHLDIYYFLHNLRSRLCGHRDEPWNRGRLGLRNLPSRHLQCCWRLELHPVRAGHVFICCGLSCLLAMSRRALEHNRLYVVLHVRRGLLRRLGELERAELSRRLHCVRGRIVFGCKCVRLHGLSPGHYNSGGCGNVRNFVHFVRIRLLRQRF